MTRKPRSLLVPLAGCLLVLTLPGLSSLSSRPSDGIAGILGGAMGLAHAEPPAPATSAKPGAGPAKGASPTFSPAPSPAGSQTTSQAPSLDPRKALVLVEKDGKVQGVGTVLSGDGRILSALSAVGTVETVRVRYPDGTVVPAKVGHKDESWDLVLLIPQEGKRTEGLRAGEGDPAQMELRTFVSAKGGPGTAVAKVQRSLDATGKNGSPLKGALDIDVRGASAAVGSPLVNAEGQVLGIFVRACRDASGASPCPPSLLGAPVAALREFLRSTPAHAVVPPVHLGIVGTPEPPSAPLRGVRVQEVAPGSPADKAGLKAGVDVIVAADSRPVPSPEKLAALLSNRGVGDRIKLLVLGPELLREVVIVLESPKPSVEKPEGKAQTPAKS